MVSCEKEGVLKTRSVVRNKVTTKSQVIHNLVVSSVSHEPCLVPCQALVWSSEQCQALVWSSEQCHALVWSSEQCQALVWSSEQ